MPTHLGILIVGSTARLALPFLSSMFPISLSVSNHSTAMLHLIPLGENFPVPRIPRTKKDNDLSPSDSSSENVAIISTKMLVHDQRYSLQSKHRRHQVTPNVQYSCSSIDQSAQGSIPHVRTLALYARI